MSISSIPTFGSAAIASPLPPNNAGNARPNDTRADASPAPPAIEAAKAVGTGLFVDKKV